MLHRMARRIDFYYDCVSPYSWLAFEVLCRYRTIWNVDLRLKPVFLGGIMRGSDNSPPAMVPAKGTYMSDRDVPRLAKHFNVPLRAPSDFAGLMTSTLPAQRVLAAVALKCPEKLEAVSREMWMRAWSRDQSVATAEAHRAALAAVGLDEKAQKEILDATQQAEAKEELKKNTQAALEAGAFGAPWIVVHPAPGSNGAPEPFFGSDRFELIAFMMGGKPWLGPDPSRAPQQQRSKL